MFAVLSRSEDKLKAGYPAAIRNAFLLAVSVHILLLLFTPPFEIEPYTMPEPNEPLVVKKVAEIIIPPPPPAVHPPNVVIPLSGDEGDVDSIPPTAIDSFPPMPVTRWKPPAARPFVVFDVPPEPVFMVKPDYPRLAREAGIEGTVLIKVVVGETGKVVDASVVDSDVTQDMDNAALAAARRCLFEPARQGSNAVEAAVVIPFEFRLD